MSIINWLPGIEIADNDDFDHKSLLFEAYKYAALNSNDQNTQLGAVITAKNHGPIIAVGANRFPEQIRVTVERLERPKKYTYMEHAERSAIYAAAKLGFSTHEATMYCPWYSCEECARAIIRSGISTVIGHKPTFDMTTDRWKDRVINGVNMLLEAGVSCKVYDGNISNGRVSIIFDDKVFSP